MKSFKHPLDRMIIDGREYNYNWLDLDSNGAAFHGFYYHRKEAFKKSLNSLASEDRYEYP